MKITLKTILSLTILGFFLIPNFVLADGMMIRPDPYSDRWDYSGESNQQAFINYENGLEKMILSVGIKEAGEETVWIFPVPAEPEKVIIDVVTKLPRLRAEEIDKKAKSNLLEFKDLLQFTQIYPIFFTAASMSSNTYKSSNESLAGSDIQFIDIQSDVTVHEHLEKEGMITEIITAKTTQGLYQYLQNKNLKIEQGSIPVLDHYIGKDFTFVVSWISNFQKAKSKSQRGIFVTFPTKKIYYPLLPTSVYGSEIVPITIRVMGFVSPKVFKDIKDYTEVSYYFEKDAGHVFVEPSLGNFYGGMMGKYRETFTAQGKLQYQTRFKGLKYTKIEINAPSKMFTDDLWMSNRAPLKTVHALFIVQYDLIYFILLLILSSVIAGLIAGIIVFKEARKNRKKLIKFGLIGIFNCFSIIGLIIAVLFAKTKEVKKEDEKLLAELKQKGYSTRATQIGDTRKFGFIFLFSISFLIILVVIIELIKLSL